MLEDVQKSECFVKGYWLAYPRWDGRVYVTGGQMYSELVAWRSIASIRIWEVGWVAAVWREAINKERGRESSRGQQNARSRAAPTSCRCTLNNRTATPQWTAASKGLTGGQTSH